MVRTAPTDDGVVPLITVAVGGITESLVALIRSEADDAGACLPDTTFVAGAESDTLGAVCIPAGEGATETDAAANHIGTGFERLGMNADS